MAFTTKEFGNRVFETIGDYEKAREARRKIELSLQAKAKNSGDIEIVAKIIPLEPNLLATHMVSLKNQLQDALNRLAELEGPKEPFHNKEGLPIGTILYGESKGRRYTIEVLEDTYLCSNGDIYDSLSGAALGVSGNRRSGWKFWKDIHGQPIGEASGRFSRSGVGKTLPENIPS